MTGQQLVHLSPMALGGRDIWAASNHFTQVRDNHRCAGKARVQASQHRPWPAGWSKACMLTCAGSDAEFVVLPLRSILGDTRLHAERLHNDLTPLT